MSFRHLSCVRVLVVAGLSVIVLGMAQASASTQTPPGGAPPGKNLPGKVTFREAPSAEKPAERAKRLKRECKGRPNAGMCLGYAS